MLEMRAWTTIFRDGGPLVFQNSYTWSACVHHRLNRKHHTFAQLGTVPTNTVVRHLGIFVQLGPDAMSDELANHAKPVRLDDLLDRSPDIADRIAEAHRFDASLQRLLGHFQKLLQLRTDRATDRNRYC